MRVLLNAVVQAAKLLARFDREVETRASLNHANIAASYGVESVAPTKRLFHP
jgi:serine/threonine protein kinase